MLRSHNEVQKKQRRQTKANAAQSDVQPTTGECKQQKCVHVSACCVCFFFRIFSPIMTLTFSRQVLSLSLLR